tara:strand:- start:9904 stop:10071 length:168 start_codon:yes stop_codon:yes gene_type:complete
MKTEILRCPKCKNYTLEHECKSCKTETSTTRPAKYSPEDKYGHYRRLAKKESRSL